MKRRYYYDMIGVNSRLDTLQAAILKVKLKNLDNYIKARQGAASFYNEKFEGHPLIKIPERTKESTHVYHQYTLQVTRERDTLQQYLKEKNIPSMIYYPVPLHLQEAYSFLGYQKGDLPVAENLCDVVLSLPMHTELDEEQLNYITTNVLEFFKR